MSPLYRDYSDSEQLARAHVGAGAGDGAGAGRAFVPREHTNVSAAVGGVAEESRSKELLSFAELSKYYARKHVYNADSFGQVSPSKAKSES